MNGGKQLVSAEVDKLLAALGGSENEAHDRCLLLLIFRHGLRVSEACCLKISQMDIEREDSHCQYLAAARSVRLRCFLTVCP